MTHWEEFPISSQIKCSQEPTLSSPETISPSAKPDQMTAPAVMPLMTSHIPTSHPSSLCLKKSEGVNSFQYINVYPHILIFSQQNLGVSSMLCVVQQKSLQNQGARDVKLPCHILGQLGRGPAWSADRDRSAATDPLGIDRSRVPGPGFCLILLGI